MTSQINPNNINGAYPVAGQDNNSQGFRDNFTNTQTNFQFAANEITDLQNKAIVNTQLAGGSVLTTQNNMLNSPLINALVSDFAYTSVSLGTLNGTVPINYSAGHYQTVTTGGNISLQFSNWPTAGQYGYVKVSITVSIAANTITLPTTVSINKNGIVGFNPLTNTISFASAGTYIFTFSSVDGGATINIEDNNELLRPFNASAENITTPGSAVSLAAATSYFGIAGTSTMALGVKGQTKVLIMNTTGTMVVTVTSPHWTTNATGTITLAGLGASCTLQCGATYWFVIGNNGATFA